MTPTYQQTKQLITDMRLRGWKRTGRGIYEYIQRTGKPIVYDLYAVDTINKCPVWKTLAANGMTPPPF